MWIYVYVNEWKDVDEAHVVSGEDEKYSIGVVSSLCEYVYMYICGYVRASCLSVALIFMYFLSLENR